MGKVININERKFEIDYVFDENKNVIGVSSPKWGFTISRNQIT